MLTRRGFVPVRRRRGSRAGASRGAPPRRRARALPRAPEASGRPGADGADGPAGSGIVAPANSASSASPPTAGTDRGATASTSHNRSTRSGSVLRGAGHCPPPRFRSRNPAAIHDLIPDHRPSAWSGSRSVTTSEPGTQMLATPPRSAGDTDAGDAPPRSAAVPSGRTARRDGVRGPVRGVPGEVRRCWAWSPIVQIRTPHLTGTVTRLSDPYATAAILWSRVSMTSGEGASVPEGPKTSYCHICNRNAPNMSVNVGVTL